MTAAEETRTHHEINLHLTSQLSPGRTPRGPARGRCRRVHRRQLDLPRQWPSVARCGTRSLAAVVMRGARSRGSAVRRFSGVGRANADYLIPLPQYRRCICANSACACCLLCCGEPVQPSTASARRRWAGCWRMPRSTHNSHRLMQTLDRWLAHWPTHMRQERIELPTLGL